jgi:hypothetical protein
MNCKITALAYEYQTFNQLLASYQLSDIALMVED